MTPDQFKQAQPFIEQLRPIESMLKNIEKSKPQVIITWGDEKTTLNSFESPDDNRTLIAAVKTELLARQANILKHMEKI